MTGELFRYSWPRWFLVQVVDVRNWSEGYDPPRIQRGRGFLHLRLWNWQIRTWKALT